MIIDIQEEQGQQKVRMIYELPNLSELLEDVLLRHPVDAASDQPLKAAAEALQRAGIHAPVLLAEASTSATESDTKFEFGISYSQTVINTHYEGFL